MEEQRSIFHANGVPLKYSIHRVTRACPPSSCRVHSSAFFLFLFSSSLFVVKKKKNRFLPWTGEGQPFDSLTSPLSPRDCCSTGVAGYSYRRLRLLSSSFCREGWLLAKFESDSWSFVAPLHLYFAVNRTRGILSSRFERGIQTRWRIIFEQTFK